MVVAEGHASGASVGTSLELKVNGRPLQVPGGTTLAGLLRILDVPLEGVALAVNRSVVPRSGLVDHVLEDGDTVELIQAVGGG